MIEAIGRRGRGDADNCRNRAIFLWMFVHGIVYWLMLLLYVAVPIWLLGAIFGGWDGDHHAGISPVGNEFC